jgi:hypothetical protein
LGSLQTQNPYESDDKVMPEQILDMIKWSVILLVGISSVGFWVQRIIKFLTDDIVEEKETDEQTK